MITKLIIRIVLVITSAKILQKSTNLYWRKRIHEIYYVYTRNEIMNLLTENLESDACVIVTTHLIHDIEQIFDKVCFLKNGQIDKIYDVEEVRSTKNKSIEELYIEYFGDDNND